MGITTQDPASDATPPTTLPHLSRERVVAAFHRNGWSFDLDEDGHVVTDFEHGLYWVFILGEDEDVLQVQGLWRGELPPERRGEAIEFCMRWSNDTNWPKNRVNLSHEGAVVIATEHTVDYQAGLTDAQLDLHLKCGIGYSEEMFEALAEPFSDCVITTEE